MTKIAFIGAGSLGFTRGLVRDILTFPLLRDATLSLMDIDPERLEFAQQSVQRIVDLGNYPAKVEATHGPRRGAEGCRRRAGDDPGRRASMSGVTISRSPRNMASTPTSAIRAGHRASSARCGPSR